MKNQIENAIRAAEAAKKEIEQIRTKIAPADPNGKKQFIDNAEMGAEWVLRQLKDLKKHVGAP